MLDAMRAAGLAPFTPMELPADGKIIRYRVDGDKAGSRNGWVVMHSHPQPAGAFGSWRTGENHTWRETSATLATPADRLALQRQVQAIHAQRAALQQVVHASARDRAAKLWARARPAYDSHPYLQSKHVRAVGIRQLRDMLLVPARDACGALHTLQFISADGTKRFLSGGRIAGCYFAIGRPDHALLLAEGLATGLSLFLATGHAVAVCFNCGNLVPVARAMRDKFPRLRLVVCGDNDSATPGNPGLTHARAAARAVGGYLAVPSFARVDGTAE